MYLSISVDRLWSRNYCEFVIVNCSLRKHKFEAELYAPLRTRVSDVKLDTSMSPAPELQAEGDSTLPGVTVHPVSAPVECPTSLMCTAAVPMHLGRC